ncbi:MAG: hypothetical protein ACRCVJ_01290 [Clostridium sp.]|uniref:hypothetical protein n=1 Tax=Clostridium sp. TaxID=1506 RepID=UPI003F3EFD42
MQKDKILNFLKTTKGKIILGVIGGIIIGSAVSGATKEQKEAVSKVAALTTQVSELENTNKDLQAKVDEAKPFFEMEKSKRDAEIEKAKAEADKAEKEREAKEKKEAEEQAKKEKAEEQKKLDAKTKTLGNGNYVAGKDFEPGVYDIIAVSGGGNVSSSNMYDGGLNAIMGVEQGDMYEKEYKNIKLPDGVTLKISGVKIKLVPKE